MKPYVLSIVCLFSLVICSAQFSKDLGDIVITDPSVGVSNFVVDKNPIGGLASGNLAQYHTSFKQPVVNVRTKEELLTALGNAKRGSTIYLDNNAVLDLSGEKNLTIPDGVTIASGRGEHGQRGAIIYTNLDGTRSLFNVSANNVRISGLTLIGPDSSIYSSPKTDITTQRISKGSGINKEEYRKQMYRVPVSSGITISGRNVEIDNCEIQAWSHASILIKSGTANIHHNYIHHNLRFGLGYGICFEGGSAIIKANIFDYNGHAITGTGVPSISVEASYNVFRENHLRAWPVDMHGGVDRKDGTNIAGGKMTIHHNAFRLYVNKPAIVIRGIPAIGAYIHNNEFLYLNSHLAVKEMVSKAQAADATYKPNMMTRFSESDAIQQKHGTGKVSVFNNRVSNQQ